ncbi:MAG: outer membrane lipoprotein-sorting protein [Opitutaceae bacterium]|nr:outer membrane lipoprotein-sorting protein [Opitutaceae bacterium]
MLLPSLALAQKGHRPPPSYLQLDKPDQEKGREILDQFRRQGIAGDYYFEFELRVLPRHDPERVLSGRLWGSRNASGPISRVSVFPPAAGAAGETRLLVQSGAAPALWRWNGEAGSPILQSGVDALFAPVAGTDLTPFDLQMPFLYWPEFVYEGFARMRGRPAHQFLFYPPPAISERRPTLAGIRAYLDTQYTALVQVEFIDVQNRLAKVLSILDLKKIGDQWIVKSIDLRDETIRNKTRFAVTAAALNQKFPAEIFAPANLAAPAAAPARADLVPLTP